MPRRVILAATVGVLVLAWAAPAAAHVTIEPPSVPKGGTATISFVVPNESAGARTNKVQVFFPPPPDSIASVSVQSMPGWHFTISMRKLPAPIQTDDGSISEVVSSITWTANSITTSIAQDEFAAFTVNADGIPDGPDQLVFRAVQSYSDGSSVRWVDPVTTGGPAPDHPTPTLQLTGESGSVTPTTSASSTASSTTVVSTEDNSARALGVIGIVVGGVALVAATGALMRRRRSQQ
jgi:uncharacterized protein YcnI